MANKRKTPLTGWRVGDAGYTVFGPKTSAPTPRIILTGKDRAAVRLAATAPEMRKLLGRILGMHETNNCGAYNGEAILSESVANEIRHVLEVKNYREVR